MEDKIKHVFTVIEKDGEERSKWVKIGIGFVNKDDSINVYFDALPLNGKINIRDPLNKTKKNDGGDYES